MGANEYVFVSYACIHTRSDVTSSTQLGYGQVVCFDPSAATNENATRAHVTGSNLSRHPVLNARVFAVVVHKLLRVPEKGHDQ